jgi:peptidoglycan hydrolase FlgJ
MDIKLTPQLLTPPPSISEEKTLKKDKDLKALRESTREFEAIYMNEMLKSMRKTIPEGGLFEKDVADDIYEEMLDMEYAKQTAAGEGMGLGKAMFDQMKVHIIGKK